MKASAAMTVRPLVWPTEVDSTTLQFVSISPKWDQNSAIGTSAARPSSRSEQGSRSYGSRASCSPYLCPKFAKPLRLVLDHQFLRGLAEIPKEPLRCAAVIYDEAGKHGKIRRQVISSPRLEFERESRRVQFCELISQLS